MGEKFVCLFVWGDSYMLACFRIVLYEVGEVPNILAARLRRSPSLVFPRSIASLVVVLGTLYTLIYLFVFANNS